MMIRKIATQAHISPFSVAPSPGRFGRLFAALWVFALVSIFQLGNNSSAAEPDIVAQALHDLETGNIASGRARLDAAIASKDISRDRLAVAFHARGELSRRANEWTKAVGDFSESIRLADRVLTHFARASSYEMLDEPEKEIEDLNVVLTADKTNQDALNMRAEALYSLGRVNAARADLETVLFFDLTNPRALANRAQIAMDQRRYLDASNDLNLGARFAPTDINIQIKLGQLQEIQGRLVQALAIYDSALRIDSSAGKLLFVHLNLLQQMGEFSRGQADCAALLALQAARATPRIQSIAPFGCGILALSMGDYKAADRYFVATLGALSKPNSSVLMARGIARALLDRAADALADFDQGLMLDPGSADGHIRRGILRRRLGHIREAGADFQAAVAVGSPEYRGLGIFWLAAIDRGQAGQAARTAITVMPPDERATWPWSVMDLSARVLPLSDAESAISREEPHLAKIHRTCTLPFYRALRDQTRNQKREPESGLGAYRQIMRELASICPPTSIENFAARLEAAPSP